MPSIRATATSLSFLLTLAACAVDDPLTTPVVALRAESCQALADVASSRPSADAAGEAVPQLPDSGMILPANMTPTGGLAIADSSVYVLDLEQGRLFRVSREGRVTARMGRTGRGPGEFNSSGGRGRAGRNHFLVAHGDTLVAYDGGSLHRFTKGGAKLGSRPLPVQARPFLESPDRIAIDDGVVYVESMRAMVRDGGRVTFLPSRHFHVWRIDGDSATSIASIELPQLPRMGTGGFFGSPAEARPSWDLRAGCLAMTDGSSGHLHLVDVRSGARDTLTVPLPERYVDAAAMNAQLPPELRPIGDPPPPALLKRVDGLALAPDGSVWFEPALRADDTAGGREAWRFVPSTRGFSTDTVAGFPYAFSPSGAAIRFTTDDEGVTRVLPLVRLQR